MRENSKVINMLLLATGVNQNIIYEYNYKYVEVQLQHPIHEIYKGVGSLISQKDMKRNS